MPEENNTFFTRRQVAEFNTSQDTLRQIATMEWNIDEMFRVIYSSGVDRQDNELIKGLFHYVTYVYADRMYAFSWTKIQPIYKEFELELEALYNDWIKNHPKEVPMALLRKIRQYKKWLYEVKQKQLRLGVPTKIETTALERLDKAMGI